MLCKLVGSCPNIMLTETVLSSDVTMFQFAVGNHVVMTFKSDRTLRIKTSKWFFVRVFSHVSTKMAWCLKQVRTNWTGNAFRTAWRFVPHLFLNSPIDIVTVTGHVNRRRRGGGA